MIPDIQGLGQILSVLGIVGGFGVWLSGQLNKIKDLIFVQDEKTNIKIDAMERNLLEKLEYHERHDDTRFGDIRDTLWEIRLRSAAEEDFNRRKRPREQKSYMTLKDDQ